MRITTRLSLLSLLSFGLALAAPMQAQTTNSLAPSDSARVVIDPVADAARLSAEAPAAAPEPEAKGGATIAGVRAGVHARETARPSRPTAAPAHANLGQSRALMVVGVAGLIVGAIIGGTPGTLIMVGGGVVGLLGLYDYLQ